MTRRCDVDLLPTVKLGAYDVTRLIVGGNPIRGYSHFSRELDDQMRAWHTPENTVATLLHAERCGVNTMQSRGDEIIFNIVRKYREAGGTMQWICQTASEYPDPFENVRQIAALEPIGIYLHGSKSDKLWQAGEFDTARDLLDAVRDTGCLVGVASHIPEVLRYVEDQCWDVDFYMSCVYNIEKVARTSMLAGGKRVAEPFDDEDRHVMCKFINATDKPCIAFKILAAGRKCSSPQSVREAFEFAFANIKATDMVDVGVLQKHQDQIGMNARIVREVLAGQ